MKALYFIVQTFRAMRTVVRGKERRILIGPWRSVKAAPVWNYLEVYWPSAGGLSAVNAIGTQLRDQINSGLTRWRMAV